MKKLVLFLTCVFIAVSVSAQTETTGVIKGAVIDKNGNPLPGATVSATDGAETTLVESDGSFVLEVPVWLKSVTASYPGLSSKKKKVDFNNPMVIKLRKKNFTGFLNFVGGLNIIPTSSPLKTECWLGVMGGIIGNWGGYAKIQLPINPANENGDLLIIGVLGANKHIYKSIYAYLGIGYGHVSDAYDDYDYYGNGKNRIDFTDGMAIDGGFLFKLSKHFDMTAGLTITTDFGIANYMPSISLGYVF